MAWFRVDDKFHSHSKVRKVLADDPAALALWVVAGSWSSDNLQDGFVPDHQLPWLIPVGTADLAQKLIAARLWRRVRGGYQFHDFTDWNQSKDQVLAKREARVEAGRKGGLNSGKARSKTEANASPNAPANAKQKRTPTRPVPTPDSSTNYQAANARSDDDCEPGAAERILGTWLTNLKKKPLSKVVNDIGQIVASALAEGQDPVDVDEALKLWQRKGNLGAGVLVSLIHEVANRDPGNVLALPGARASPHRESTTDARVRDGAALIERFKALEARP